MSAILDRDVAAFETHRRALTGLAYRMLGVPRLGCIGAKEPADSLGVERHRQ